MNYIAIFNGSKSFIPEDATFDEVGQEIEELDVSFNT